MTAFPSANSDQVITTHLETASSQPKNARVQILDGLNKTNTIMQSYNQAQGICGLGTDGLVDSGKLLNKVNHGAIQNNAVHTDNIADANTSDQGITGAKVRDNTIPTAKLSQVVTTIPTSGASDSNIPTQKAVADFAGTLIGASDIKELLKATETLSFKVGFSNNTTAKQSISLASSNHANATAFAVPEETHTQSDAVNMGTVHGAGNGVAFDVLHNTYPIAGGANKNFTVSNSNDTITIANNGTYVFEFGYQTTYSGDDYDDSAQSGEGWDFKIFDEDDNVLHTHQIRGAGGDSQNWAGKPNFRTTLVFNGAGTNANKIHFGHTRVGSPDGWSGAHRFDPYMGYMYQTQLTSALTSKFGL